MRYLLGAALVGPLMFTLANAGEREPAPSTPEPIIEIPTIGRFEARRLDDRSIAHYTSPVRFKGGKSDLIIYPNGEGLPFTDARKKELAERFRKFERSVDTAIHDLPRRLRRVCREYQIKLGRVTDKELRTGLKWQIIKLLPEGGIECYTNHRKVSKNFDIVLEFSADMRLVDVSCDG
jgi:hypothetical protein